jgi:hypothetical protein
MTEVHFVVCAFFFGQILSSFSLSRLSLSKAKAGGFGCTCQACAAPPLSVHQRILCVCWIFSKPPWHPHCNPNPNPNPEHQIVRCLVCLRCSFTLPCCHALFKGICTGLTFVEQCTGSATVCEAVFQTDGATCDAHCESMGLNCEEAWDETDNTCSTKQTSDSRRVGDGCTMSYGSQICRCMKDATGKQCEFPLSCNLSPPSKPPPSYTSFGRYI